MPSYRPLPVWLIFPLSKADRSSLAGITTDVRARWRARQGWQPLGLLSAELLAARARALQAVPAVDAHEACGGTRGGGGCNSSASMHISQTPRRSLHSLPRSEASAGSSIPSARSPGQRPCLPICHDTHTPRRHLEPSSDCAQRAAGHLQGQRLLDRRTGPLHHDDARHRRVHPPFPHPRPAKGFHRIRHYGLFAGSDRAETIATARKLLNLAPPAAEQTGETDPAQPLAHPCPCCGGHMFIIETFQAGYQPRHRPTTPLVVIRIDTS